MDLPDEVLLTKVQTGNAHYDKRSIEESTGRIGAKYKLAGNIIKLLDIYIFFILTKRESACKGRFTLRVYKKNWEKRSPLHLNRKYSYIDLTKNEVLEKDQILSKIKDKKNRFACVAKLCEEKYEELQNICRKMKSVPIISREVEDIIELGLLEITNERLRKLDL